MKKKKHLTPEQRCQISALLQTGTRQTEIARIVGTGESAISRELKRNSSKRGHSPNNAQMFADERKKRFAHVRKYTKEMEDFVRGKLESGQWSPGQITGWCRSNGVAMVSRERIYQSIRQDKRQGGSLYKQCRHRLKHRKRPAGGKKAVIPDKVSIGQRPEVANNRERFGDWEIDTVFGPDDKGAVLTATERTTGFLLMRKLKKGKNAKNLLGEIVLMLLPYRESVLSITSDNGTEFYGHKEIARRLNTLYFFADPYASHQRGLNEYTNGLIRQYIPKNQTFEHIEGKIIRQMQHKINRRPRKKLNFENPKKIFFQKIALAS